MPTPQKIYAGSTLIYESPVTTFPQLIQTSSAVTVTASATTHTKGSWSQLIASTSAQSDWLLVYADQGGTPSNGVDTSFMLDIGTGSSGSEVVRIENLFRGYTQASDTGRHNPGILFPLRIASGTRIAARAQAAVASRTGSVTVVTFSSAARSSMPTTLDTIGADTTATRGTNLPTNNTYVQLTASTSQAYQALIAVPAASGTAFDADTSLYTIASGASGSEQALFTFNVATAAAERLSYDVPRLPQVYDTHIPAGTRIAARQSVGRTYRDVIVYGVPYA